MPSSMWPKVVPWIVQGKVSAAMRPIIDDLIGRGSRVWPMGSSMSCCDWRIWDCDRAGPAKRLDRDKLIEAVQQGRAREFVETEIAIYLLTKEV